MSLSEEPSTEGKEEGSVQIVLKVPADFIRRFDVLCAKLGYTRAEAVRESMRCFSDLTETKARERPEEVLAQASQMMQAIFAPLIQQLQIAEKAKEMPVASQPRLMPEASSKRDRGKL